LDLEGNRSQKGDVGFDYSELTPAECSFDEFCHEVTTRFAEFKTMRGLARNSMWMSLICLLSAAATLRNPLHRHFPKIQEMYLATSAMKAAAIFIWITIITSMNWLFTTGGAHIYFRWLTTVFFICSIACIADAVFEKEEFDMLDLMISLTIVVSMGVVAVTVCVFRNRFVGLARKHAEVH
jgi:hypothetical protein